MHLKKERIRFLKESYVRFITNMSIMYWRTTQSSTKREKDIRLIAMN